MTAFRVAYGGAQALYGITPDLTTVGKIVGIDLMASSPEIRVMVLIGVGLTLIAAGYWYIRRKA